MPANHGVNFFAGGDLTDAVATQFIDVSAISPTIDAGSVPFTLSADLGGYTTQEDAATVTATFLDDSFSIVDVPMTIGPVTAAERGNLTGFQHQYGETFVPVGARHVQIDIHMAWTNGYNDGYADNVSFVLAVGIHTLYLPLVAR